MKLNLVNYCIASDGGSMALSFETESQEEYWVSINKGLESETKGNVYSIESGDLPLSREQKAELIKMLRAAKISIDGGEQVIKDIIVDIESA